MSPELEQEPHAMTTTTAPVEEGAPSWTMTFGDMMSLLLCFFILLFSMSEIEVDKFRLAAQSMAGAMGGVVNEPVENPVGFTSDSTTEVILDEELIQQIASDRILDRVAAMLQDFVDENDLQENLIVTREDLGVALSIQDVALYSPGQAEIDIRSQWIVEDLAVVTMGIDLPFHVSGHTDTIPISNSRFRSNWELSAVRAAGVARTLVSIGQDPFLVKVEAFGEFKPIASNDTPDGRSLNRRVEISISRQDVLESDWFLEEVGLTDPADIETVPSDSTSGGTS